MRVLLKWWLLLVGASTSLVLMAGCGVGPNARGSAQSRCSRLGICALG
ncbi:hypothetical protein [Propioniciclava flava]